ncbi:two pore domain potassium channel family protein [Cellulomonas sp. JZ18]|uniref:potassium channel family protein n=1 Tax=Cellulomonas sp. JZ18 TaxID=2654191 RepID=UPI0012D39139|nr:potassium channel family protein [Cellulomonas sp. JZ18]QGQ20205.1 two pore domain potassium channel family protein [Cellulomonas sp. JZ18]
MSGPAAWAAAVGGVLLAAFALRDVFHTLWHPEGEGVVSRTVMRAAWHATGPFGPRARNLAGPAGLVGVVVTWAALVILGAALVYWPHVSDQFVYGTGLRPDERSSFLDALYLSAVVLSTLGLGDIVPRGGWLQVVVGLQGLIGFSLLTAAVSWVLQVQSALVRRRTTTRVVHGLRRADAEEAVPSIALLTRLTEDVAAMHVDLYQTTPTYYFRDQDPRAALATALPHLYVLAERASAEDDTGVRAAASALRVALDDLVGLLDEQYLHTGGDRDAVLRRYAQDQRHAP